MKHFHFKKSFSVKFIYSASAFFMCGVLTAVQAEVSWLVPIAFLFSAVVFYWLGIIFRRSPYVTVIGQELLIRERLFQVRRLPLRKARASSNASRLLLESENGDVISIRSSLLSEEDYSSLKDDVLSLTGAFAKAP